MEVEAKENLQFSTPVRLSTHVEAHSLLPASSVKQRYQELWQQYSQGVQASNLVKLDYQVGRRGFEAGLSQKEIARMLIAGSAYVQQLEQEQAREKAREYVNQTAHAVCQQEQEKQVRRERSPQLEL